MISNGRTFQSIVELLDDERESLVNDIVSRVLEAVETSISPSTDKVLVSTDELVDLFSISKSTIVKLRKEGLPTIQIGNAIRFDVIV